MCVYVCVVVGGGGGKRGVKGMSSNTSLEGEQLHTHHLYVLFMWDGPSTPRPPLECCFPCPPCSASSEAGGRSHDQAHHSGPAQQPQFRMFRAHRGHRVVGCEMLLITIQLLLAAFASTIMVHRGRRADRALLDCREVRVEAGLHLQPVAHLSCFRRRVCVVGLEHTRIIMHT